MKKNKCKKKELIFKGLTIIETILVCLATFYSFKAQMLNTPYNNEYDKRVLILILIAIPVSIALYTMMRPSKKVKK